MPGAARATLDKVVGGGLILSGSPNVFIDGMPAVRVGDPVAPHRSSPPHTNSPKIAQGSPTVFCNGLPLSRLGDMANCKDIITGGSNDVFIDGRDNNVTFYNKDGKKVNIDNKNKETTFRIGS